MELNNVENTAAALDAWADELAAMVENLRAGVKRLRKEKTTEAFWDASTCGPTFPDLERFSKAHQKAMARDGIF